MLLDTIATVIQFHTRTVEMAFETCQAELLSVATGDIVSDGVVAIDVGMDRDSETGKLSDEVDLIRSHQSHQLLLLFCGRLAYDRC